MYAFDIDIDFYSIGRWNFISWFLNSGEPRFSKSRGNRALSQYPLLKLLKSQGQESLVTQKVRTMWLIQNQKGQNLIEYAIIVAVVASAMLAMSIYVSRSVQATQQAIQEGYRD